MSCFNCGKETNNPKFCCKSCSATYTNKETPKRKTKRKCIVCGAFVSTHRNARCDIHTQEYKESIEFKNKTLREYQNRDSVKDKPPSWINSHVRNFARSWLKHLTKLPCAKCGYDKHVELAHIKAVSEFDLDAKLGDIHSESNVIQLCPNCHWEFDNLPRNGLFTKLLESRGGIEPLVIHPPV